MMPFIVYEFLCLLLWMACVVLVVLVMSVYLTTSVDITTTIRFMLNVWININPWVYKRGSIYQISTLLGFGPNSWKCTRKANKLSATKCEHSDICKFDWLTKVKWIYEPSCLLCSSMIKCTLRRTAWGVGGGLGGQLPNHIRIKHVL